MKPGYKTTEFWASLALAVGAVAASAEGALPPKYAAIAASVAALGYAVGRGLAKSHTSGA